MSSVLSRSRRADAPEQAPAGPAPVVLPRVDLLPPEIGQAARARQARLAAAAVVALAALGVAGVWYSSTQSTAEAQAELEAAQATGAALQAEIAQFAEVRQVTQEVADTRTQLSLAMADEVLWSTYLTDLSLTVPDQTWLTEMTVTRQAPTPPEADGTGGSGSIGVVQFLGGGDVHEDTAVWLESLVDQDGYANPYFTVSQLEEDGRLHVTFDSTVSLTPAALSGRYLEGELP